MKKITIIIALLFFGNSIAQQDANTAYKKRVLETAEIDFLSSYYSQKGDNAAVTGGIGTEELTDFTPTIIISVPLNTDDVLTVDAGISAYTSASSSNGNPFDTSGASTNGETNATPWAASTGASKNDVWYNVSLDYAHSSDDRNTIWNVNAAVATEYDYSSIGFGGGLTKLFNDKNTTLSLSGNVYLDTWKPIYPTELNAYKQANGNLDLGFFTGVNIFNQNGNTSANWQPINGFDLISDTSRNSYSLSFSFSQILTKKAQVSLFLDLVKQKGWLANPLQRVYFADVDNYYIGNPAAIPNYTSNSNTSVFQLADDIERLPSSRFKIPIGIKFNYYINEVVALRTYYRYYFDDWGVKSHTASIELPIKITEKFTLYPSYRFYNQTKADYFAPFDAHLSSSTFYTSDYDLSKFNASQYSFGIGYTDIFTKFHIYKFGLKSINLKYANYSRSTGLKANITSLAFTFVLD